MEATTTFLVTGYFGSKEVTKKVQSTGPISASFDIEDDPDFAGADRFYIRKDDGNRRADAIMADIMTLLP
jgi:hypothetical protein